MLRLAVAILLAIQCGAALAQAFPSRPMKILVPFPPGGGTDVAARALAEYLGREFAQPVVVDNRPGGNSVIATEALARSAPDGHTLLLTTDFHSINAAFELRLPYDSLRDFAFVAQVSTSPLMLVGHPSAGVKTLGAGREARRAGDRAETCKCCTRSAHLCRIGLPRVHTAELVRRPGARRHAARGHHQAERRHRGLA